MPACHSGQSCITDAVQRQVAQRPLSSQLYHWLQQKWSRENGLQAERELPSGAAKPGPHLRSPRQLGVKVSRLVGCGGCFSASRCTVSVQPAISKAMQDTTALTSCLCVRNCCGSLERMPAGHAESTDRRLGATILPKVLRTAKRGRTRISEAVPTGTSRLTACASALQKLDQLELGCP